MWPFLAIGVTVYRRLKRAERLKEEGIDACVVNCRFIKPWDKHMVCDVARAHKKIITVEET